MVSYQVFLLSPLQCIVTEMQKYVGGCVNLKRKNIRGCATLKKQNSQGKAVSVTVKSKEEDFYHNASKNSASGLSNFSLSLIGFAAEGHVKASG